MILLAIMLFVIGHELNMSTAYWVIYWIFISCNLLNHFLESITKYSLSDILAVGIIMILEKIFGEKRLKKLDNKIRSILD